jgi:8-oxo-dGTP pyrophosphatase MutT (NUDIX family)
MDPLHWTTKEKRKMLDGRIFDVLEVDRLSPEGNEGSFIQLDAPDWVTVLPLTVDSLGHACFVMVRQYRHGNEEVTLEFPAGTVERDEHPRDAALRELLEETGGRPLDLIKIGEISPNPAFMNNSMTFYVAEAMEFIQQQNLDEHEQITVELVRVNDVIHSMGTGMYNNGVMVAGLLYFLRWKGLISDMRDEQVFDQI